MKYYLDSKVPHIKTPLDHILYELERKIIDNHIEIEAWFRQEWQKSAPLVTCSVDLRNAGYKLASVDANVFPAGFNNLSKDFRPLCIQAFTSHLSLDSRCKNILLLVESHTRNKLYFENVFVLKNIIEAAGYAVRIASLNATGEEQYFLESGEIIKIYGLQRRENTIYSDDFKPCVILSNNDFSSGFPDILNNLEQTIIPSAQYGWNLRSKSKHFDLYNECAYQFSKILGVDPWLISTCHKLCVDVDFHAGHNFDLLEYNVGEILNKVRIKYKEYNIDQKPFVAIKSDSGTYGMGVLMVSDENEIKNFSRKQKNKMIRNKGGSCVSKVIIQEGVPTSETLGSTNAFAEPVIYMIGSFVVGGFYRVHKGKNMNDNLNSPGMEFETLSFDKCCNLPNDKISIHSSANKFYAYSVIARLAHLASTWELV